MTRRWLDNCLASTFDRGGGSVVGALIDYGLDDTTFVGSANWISVASFLGGRGDEVIVVGYPVLLNAEILACIQFSFDRRLHGLRDLGIGRRTVQFDSRRTVSVKEDCADLAINCGEQKNEH